MSQRAATIESFPMAFALVKEMQADGLEWDEGYRPLGGRALAEIIERRIGRGVSDIGMPLTPERVWRAMTPDQISIGAGAGLPRIRSAAFSAIMITTALILPPTKSGITEASTMRSRSMPRTRICPSTTESGSAPRTTRVTVSLARLPSSRPEGSRHTRQRSWLFRASSVPLALAVVERHQRPHHAAGQRLAERRGVGALDVATHPVMHLAERARPLVVGLGSQGPGRRPRDAGPEMLADDLRICADHCRAIVLGEEPDPELAQAFRELARLDMKPVYPFLLPPRGAGGCHPPAPGARRRSCPRSASASASGRSRGEMLRLKWSEVDGQVLRLADTKTGPRQVWLSEAAQAIIAHQPRTGSAYVFPSPKCPARPCSSAMGLWYRARKEAGIDDVRLHDLRHTVASQAVARGVALSTVASSLSDFAGAIFVTC